MYIIMIKNIIQIQLYKYGVQISFGCLSIDGITT